MPLALLCLLLGAWDGGPDHTARRCDWGQWGQGPAHDGSSCSVGQGAARELAHVVVDPFTDQEIAESGFIVAHYQVPLIDEDGDVFVMQKAGTFVSCDPPGSGQPFPCGDDARDAQVWTETAMRWHHGQLGDRWTFLSDWKPLPARFEAMFQPALAGRSIYVPGAGGTVFQVDRDTGQLLARINPFGQAVDPTIYVAGGIAADERGNIYYNAVQLDPDDPVGSDVRGAWLIEVTPRGRVLEVDYTTLVADAPAADDLCYRTFRDQSPRPPHPWPPTPESFPPQSACQSQRPGFNVTPAIGPGGTIFTVTRAHASAAYSFLVALHPDLSLAWTVSLRDQLFDGCGVLVPYGGFDCPSGTELGVDPATNLPPAGQVTDDGSASPVALPDGGVLYGALTTHNQAGAGHLMKFDREGDFVGSFDFGWDTTPAIYRHDGTYSIVLKENRYLDGLFYITQLDPDLDVEWRFQNTTIETCERQHDGTIICVDDGLHPTGFEWCANAVAVDRRGSVFTTSEDGNFYVIGQGGVERGRLFLNRTLGALYTPLALDSRGRAYAMNDGDLFVIGR